MAFGLGKKNILLAQYPLTERREAIVNPLCGFYSIYRFECPDGNMPDSRDNVESFRLDTRQTIALVEINLRAFNEGPLSDAALKMVERVFKRFAAEGMAMLLRFLYDWEGKNIQAEPKSLAIILRHMQQLSPLLRAYSAYIYILQGLFIGNWGEMHNSRYLSESSICQLTDKLASCAGPHSFLSVRSPSLWRTATRSFNLPDLSRADAPMLARRIGLFNDGMLASNSDLGTYGALRREDARLPGDKLIREEELRFQSGLCLSVPNGGEVVNPDAQNDFVRALPDLRLMRVSYLNSNYDTEVFDKWRAYSLSRAWGDWRDRSGFDYIAAHIGYRFSIKSVELSRPPTREGVLRAFLCVQNEGFAPCYRRLKLCLGLIDPANGRRMEQEVGVDTRAWHPDKSVAFGADIEVDAESGSRLLLYVNATEPLTGQHVRFSNAFTYVEATGDSLLGVAAWEDA